MAESVVPKSELSTRGRENLQIESKRSDTTRVASEISSPSSRDQEQDCCDCSSTGSRISQGREQAKLLRESHHVASDTFCERMSCIVSQDDVMAIITSQTQALAKFEKTNEKICKFNELSATRYEVVNQHFKNHTKMLLDMKKDLDLVFRRIRTLKSKLTKQYGHAFIATSASIQKLEEELGGEDDDEEEKPQVSTQQVPINDISSANLGHNSSTNTERKTIEQDTIVTHATSSRTYQSSRLGNETGSACEQTIARRTFLRPELSSSDDSDLCSGEEESNTLSDSSAEYTTCSTINQDLIADTNDLDDKNEQTLEVSPKETKEP